MPAQPTNDDLTRQSRHPVALAVVFITTFCLILDLTVINVALRDMMAALTLSFTDMQWVLDAYATSMAATLLLAGLLADKVGPRPTIIVGALLFAATSTMAACATGAGMIIAARLLQGVGAAALLASIPVLIVQNLPPDRRMLGFAVFGGASGIALAGGPLIGGLLLSLSWTWIFWVNLPAMALVLTLVSAVHSVRSVARPILGPVLTSIVLGGAMFALVYILTHAGHTARGEASLTIAIAALPACVAGVVLLQRSARFRLFDTGRFTDRTFLVLNAVTLAVNFAVFPLIMLSVILFEVVHGYSAVETGVRLLVLTGALLVGSLAAPPLQARFGPRHALTISLGILFAGLILLAPLDAGDSWIAVVPGFLLAGLGFGIFNPVRAESTVALVTDEDAGLASGIGNTLQELGVGCGVALLGSVFLTRLESTLGVDISALGFGSARTGTVLDEAFAESWTLTVGISAGTVAVALVFWGVLARRLDAAEHDGPGSESTAHDDSPRRATQAESDTAPQTSTT